MKRIVLSFILLFNILFVTNANTFAQGTEDKKLFRSRGVSAFTDLANSPTVFYPSSIDNSGSVPTVSYSAYMASAFSYFTYTYQFRYNIHEFSSNASLSLSTPLSLGIAFTISNSDMGFGNLNIPLFFEFNYGNGSTYSSDKEKGLVLGAGFEYIRSPILGGGDNVKDIYNKEVVIPKGWFQPAFEIGYRYWNRNNKAREVNFKYGAGFPATIPGPGTYLTPGEFSLSSHSIKLTFLFLLDY